MSEETLALYMLLARNKYHLWVRKSIEEKEKEIKAHGEILYSRYAEKVKPTTTSSDVADEVYTEQDTNPDSTGDDSTAEDIPQLKCTKEFCPSYGKSFRSASQLTQHERLVSEIKIC